MKYNMAKKESTLVLVPQEVLLSKIFLLRNEKVMLDRDLAQLYGIKAFR